MPELAALLESREISAVGLTTAYLDRIGRLDPVLHAVIETNPAALEIAARRDTERRAGRVRGPLHGIPILVKDNIATNDAMETTAGSLALSGSRVPRDAAIVARLRAAGAVVLGKANLSEWANLRGVHPKAVRDAGVHVNGWSARGGFTRNPYDLAADPCGSSSGSGVAPAANLCAVAIGTETDGSIVCPSGRNAVVGLKPTVGLVSQAGIIPISHSQDTAGPMGRSVTDVAIVLNAIRSPFGEVVGRRLPRDYRTALRRGALRGARIGVDRRHLSGEHADDGLNRVAEQAFETLAGLGATLVDPIESVDTEAIEDDEITVLVTEFKAGLNTYLSGLRNTNVRSLADVIAFNDDRCEDELRFFGQEWMHVADATGGLEDAAYRAARARCIAATRANGIDRILARDRLDAIVGPAYGDSSGPAVAGYPVISVPTGLTEDGRPAGVWLSAGFLAESTLLGFAFDLETAVGPRPLPTFAGTLPPEPPDAGICATPPERRRRATRADLHD
ncbi:MAG: amidase family protein [Chloroflexota bacterium]